MSKKVKEIKLGKRGYKAAHEYETKQLQKFHYELNSTH